MSKTRGSEKRARNGWLAMRSSPEEVAVIRRKASDAGVSVSELMRAATLGYRLPASRIQVAALTKVLAEIGKIGSNINQIAYHLNAGRPGDVMEGSVDAALTELLEWRMALMQSLGLERPRKSPNKDKQ